MQKITKMKNMLLINFINNVIKNRFTHKLHLKIARKNAMPPYKNLLAREATTATPGLVRIWLTVS